MADDKADKPGNGDNSQAGSGTTGAPRRTNPNVDFSLAIPPTITEKELRDREACIDKTHKKPPPLKEGESSVDFGITAGVPPTIPKPPK